MIKVRFSASGYGTTTERYRSRELATVAIEEEAAQILADHGGDPAHGIVRCGDEWTAYTRTGEEIARWEIS